MPSNLVTNDVSNDFFEAENRPVNEKTITIQPGSGKAVGLGVYKSTTPDPQFKVTYDPDLGDGIGLSTERLDIPGQSKYMLLYQFQNFSQKACQITLHLRNHVASIKN